MLQTQKFHLNVASRCLRSTSVKDGAYYCYCACILRISRYSGFLWVVPTNTGIFLRGLILFGESRIQQVGLVSTKKIGGNHAFFRNKISQIAPLIEKRLTSIFNKSFTTGIIPDKFKISLVAPVYKNEDQCLFSNYRPVTVLPCFSKILEKIVYKRLINFIQKYDILYNKQFGFRKNHSTETAIIDLVAKLTDAIEKKSV